jgi:hypothetical protein
MRGPHMNFHKIRFALTAIPFAVAGFGMTATAQTGDEAAISFKRGATAAETYASIEKSARDYCRSIYDDSSAIAGVWPTAVSNCAAEVVDQTVNQVQSADLMEYHVAVTRSVQPSEDGIIIVTADNN